MIAAALLQGGLPFGKFALRDQDVRRTLVEVDAHAIAGLQSASPPPAAASGEALRIDGEPDVPDCRPSPMHGNDVMPLLISAAGGCMFTTSHEPG
jgi:hypothetical protein